MSDVQENQEFVSLGIDDKATDKIFVTVDGREIQLNQEEVDINFDMNQDEIMEKLVPMIQEDSGVEARPGGDVDKGPPRCARRVVGRDA